MSELKYTEEHEWVRPEEDGSLTFGVTDYAQDSLGDVVYVELPEVGRTFQTGDEVAIVESVKAAGEIKAPVGGSIVAVNERLADEPELVNSDPLGEGWFFRLKPDEAGILDSLMDEAQYKQFQE